MMTFNISFSELSFPDRGGGGHNGPLDSDEPGSVLHRPPGQLGPVQVRLQGKLNGIWFNKFICAKFCFRSTRC